MSTRHTKKKVFWGVAHTILTIASVVFMISSGSVQQLLSASMNVRDAGILVSFGLVLVGMYFLTQMLGAIRIGERSHPFTVFMIVAFFQSFIFFTLAVIP